MREKGWYNKEGVTILEGKWQDFVGTKRLEDMLFDAVYTDTFSEDYEGDIQRPFLTPGTHQICFEDLCRFFDHVPKLLAGPDGRFSFFNGLGATSTSRTPVTSLRPSSSADCGAVRCLILRRIYTLGRATPSHSWH